MGKKQRHTVAEMTESYNQSLHAIQPGTTWALLYVETEKKCIII